MNTCSKKVLMISYFFPPLGGGGVQRSIKFSKYLPDFGWEPIVLTVKNKNYWALDESLLGELPEDLQVYRTFSFEPFLLYAIFGKLGLRKLAGLMDRLLFIPDNRLGWLPLTVLKGLRLLRIENCDLIYTTSPPHSSHFIGYFLKKLSGVKWIADFRDPWTQNPMRKEVSRFRKSLEVRLETLILRNCDISIANTEGNRLKLIEKFGVDPAKVSVITNGYDKTDFADFKVIQNQNGPFKITYAGSFYQEHSPEILFQALRKMLDQKPELRNEIKVNFLGSFEQQSLMKTRFGLEGVVEYQGYKSHKETIHQLVAADCLLLILPPSLVRSSWVPAKLYEYIASRKPILALVPNGEARDLILKTGSGIVACPSNVDSVVTAINSVYDRYAKGSSNGESDLTIMKKYERKELTRSLARFMDCLLNHNPVIGSSKIGSTMNILVLTDNYPDSDNLTSGIFVHEQLKILAQKCKVKVIFPKLWGFLGTNRRWNKRNGAPKVINGVEFFRPKLWVLPRGDRLFFRSIFFFLGAMKVIRNLRKRYRIDLVHAHFACPAGFAAVLLGMIYKKPVVVTVHGSDLHTYTKNKFLNFLVRFTLMKADAVVTVSNSLKDLAIDFGINEEKIWVINNGVDLSLFYPRRKELFRRELGLLNGKKVILYVGRLERIKRLDRLIDSFYRLSEGMENAYLVIVGHGASENDLKRYCKALKLENRVRFTGEVDRFEVAKWINASEFVCFTSENEGFPAAALEAVACGKPVVGLRIGGLGEIIEHDSNGILVEETDKLGLEQALRMGLRRKWNWRKISEDAKRYCWKGNVDRYLEVYKSVNC